MKRERPKHLLIVGMFHGPFGLSLFVLKKKERKSSIANYRQKPDKVNGFVKTESFPYYLLPTVNKDYKHLSCRAKAALGEIKSFAI